MASLRPMPEPERGAEFGSGRFLIVGQIGRGGMGEVFRAQDTRLKRPVALKRLPAELRSDPALKASLLSEAERASSLNSPNIAALYDVVEDGPELCLVMEYVEGSNLRERLNHPMPLPTFIDVALQCVDALMAAHESGLVHRDIKPENIMLTPSGRVKVLDFGLARARVPSKIHLVEAGSEETTSGADDSIAGTSGYMSPEALLAQPIDGRSDIFSLGVVFYEALTGRHPFRDTSFVATAGRILHAAPEKIRTFNLEVPRTLEIVIDRMLAKKAEDRYASAQELRADLDQVKQQLASGEWRLPHLSFATRRMILSVAMIVALALLAVWLAPTLATRWGTSQAALPQTMRVAVLPFRALSTDAEGQAYSNGLTETVTTRLTKASLHRPLDVVSSLDVHSRNIRDIDTARKELGANLVLEGSVRRDGDRIRANFALLDAQTHKQLRAETLTSTLQAGFAFEDQLSDVVMRMLELEIPPATDQSKSQSAEARELYVRARGYLQDFDKPEQLARAVANFTQATALDPKFAAAYAALGTAYWLQYDDAHDPAVVTRARAACNKALELDPMLPAAHECSARVHQGTGESQQAIHELQQVLEADPTNESAIRLLANSYESVGRVEEAERALQKAVEVRPLYQAGHNALGIFYFRHARYEDAARAFERSIDVAPDGARGYLNLAGVKIEQRKYEEALKLLERSISIEPTAAAYSNRGTVKSYLKEYDSAAADYQKALELGENDWVSWANLGEAYYWSKRQHDEARSAFTHAISLANEAVTVNPKDAATRAELARMYAMNGDQKRARAELARSLKADATLTRTMYDAAVIEHFGGNRKRALEWLEKAVKKGYSPASVQDDPAFAALHEDPRFKKLLTTMSAGKGQ